MKKAEKTAIYGIFTAIIVVLQLLSYTLKVGTFNLSLVLIPIVFGAYLYGPNAGAFFGAVFGVIVVIACAMGIDGGGYILFSGNPILTSLVCIIKGTAAGFVAGLICSAFAKSQKNRYIGVILAAAAAPIVNTGLFSLAMLTLFKDTLYAWAGGTPILSYVFLGLIGGNFLIEFFINIVFAPSLVRIKKALKK